MMAEEQNQQRNQSKITKIVKEFEDLNGRYGKGDVRLTLVGKESGCGKVSMDVHKRVLLEKSGFFRESLRGREKGIMQSVEISECDDVEVYLETLVLMYSHDLKKRLIGEEVSKILALLKVYTNSNKIIF